VIKDLGGSFGATKLNSSKMKLSDWDEAVMWKDAKQCVALMPRSFTGSLEDRRSAERCRFLAERLMLLRDKRIRSVRGVERGEAWRDVDGPTVSGR
jgi:hypothetical protein